MRISDWSSDVCSSDLFALAAFHVDPAIHGGSQGARLECPNAETAFLVGNEGLEKLAANELRAHAAAPVNHFHRNMHTLLTKAHRHRICGRARSEEHTSDLQSLMSISYAVFCLKKKKKKSILYNST